MADEAHPPELRSSRQVGRLRLLAGVAILAFASSGVGIVLAAAASPSSPTTVINGCYDSKNGQLRIVTAGQQCLSSEKAINWNQVGPQGVAGSTGPSGPTGPQGSSGPSGPSGPA